MKKSDREVSRKWLETYFVFFFFYAAEVKSALYKALGVPQGAALAPLRFSLESALCPFEETE